MEKSVSNLWRKKETKGLTNWTNEGTFNNEEIAKYDAKDETFKYKNEMKVEIKGVALCWGDLEARGIL